MIGQPWYRRRAVVAFALLVALAGVGWAGWRVERNHAAVALVQRTHRASSQVCLVGLARTTIWVNGRPVQGTSMVLRDRGGRSRTHYLTGPSRGLLMGSTGEVLWQQEKNGAMVQFSRYGSTPTVQSTDDILANYRPRLMGRGKVAERSTAVVGLFERRTGALAKRLWIEHETGVILRQEAYDPAGYLLGRTEYQAVVFPEGLEARLFLPPVRVQARVQTPPTTSRRVSPPRLAELVGFPLRTPTYLPQGYRLQGHFAFECPCHCGGHVAHIRYSDGLRALSIFEGDPKHHNCALADLTRAGSVAATVMPGPGQVQAVALTKQGVAILVVGDLPKEELTRIIYSLR